jgi:hypothetical protein
LFAHKAFFELKELFLSCGIEESEQKAITPSTRMEFLRIVCDSDKLTLEISESRLKEMLSVVVEWDSKQLASKREVQSLVGKLNFVGSCVKPGRMFISRLLNWLRSIYSVEGKVLVPEFVKIDIKWWKTFLPLFNGISMMMKEEWSKPDGIFTSDACLSGCGGMFKEQFFYVEFPHSILDEHLHINALKMLAVIACLKMWGTKYKEKRILIKCDNITGKSRSNLFFSSYLRI